MTNHDNKVMTFMTIHDIYDIYDMTFMKNHDNKVMTFMVMIKITLRPSSSTSTALEARS